MALIEAKDADHAVGDGMQQAPRLRSATLDIPFVFASNGDGFVFHDKTLKEGEGDIEKTLTLDEFPTPAQLWEKYRAFKGLDPEEERIVLQDYHPDAPDKQPRYYQQSAINATVEAIAKGQDRNLLVMATGTGKTYTAFQIIWRLWKAGVKKRILYLADRNVLIDQTMVNDFRPFGPAMAKLSHQRQDHRADDGTEVELTPRSTRSAASTRSFEIYLGLYQAITGPEERQKLFREFSPGFFDLIVIDECHRGSAAEDSAWREILDYFSAATQIGMTATPKETKYVSNINYFGEPTYSYSLKQGIRDGFLAPYKVIKVHLDVDIEGYRPTPGEKDITGAVIPDQHYNQKDFDRTLVIDDRTKLVAKKVSDFLKEKRRPLPEDHRLLRGHRARGPHAPGARSTRTPTSCAQNHRYVMRITGSDAEGQAQLGNFIDPESSLPRPGHHLAPALDRRGRPDLPPDRAGPRGRLDDRVQADRRARHARPRGHEEVLLHADRLPRRQQPLRGPRLRRRAGADLRARRGRSPSRRPTMPPPARRRRRR